MNRIITRIVLSIISALTIIGAVDAAINPPEAPKPAEVVRAVRIAHGPDWQASARRYVRNTLKDPDSAIFGDVRTYSRAVCGTVNARNGFGGYAGGELFIVFNRDRVMYAGQTLEGKSFQATWKRLCR